MNRIGGRFGMEAGQGMQLAQRPNMPTAKPQAPAQMPAPTQAPVPEVGGNRPGIPPATGVGGGFSGTHFDAIRNRFRGARP